jgi:hypothetical protein
LTGEPFLVEKFPIALESYPLKIGDTIVLINHPDETDVQSLAVVGRLQANWVYFDGRSDGTYQDGNDYRGWGISTGIRMSW